jgi:hypothetical protein
LLAAAVGSDFKGKISIVGYLVAIPVGVRPPTDRLFYLYPGSHHVADSR